MSRTASVEVEMFGWYWVQHKKPKIDIRRFWEVVDSFPQDERRLLHLVWDDDGTHRDIFVADALRQLGLKRSVYDRAFRKLRHPQRCKYFVSYPPRYIRSTEYGYA